MVESHRAPARAAGTRAVGVREVAALAGVSRQTVSRVLNDQAAVAPETRDRVTAAMAELGYRMNNAARALGTRRSRTIGVLASNALHYGPVRSIESIEAAARAAGYWVAAAFADSADPGAVSAALEHLLAQSVDGLVVLAPHLRTLRLLEELALTVPTVTLHAADRGPGGVSVDHVAGARIATACLADAGHERIAHVAGPADWLEAEARRQGYRAELAARGLTPLPIIGGDWTAAAGHRATAAVLASGATGVFAANDQVALGLMRGLAEAGTGVPDQISIVGFDDAPDSAYYSPPLTTLRQDFGELARRAVARLTHAQAGEQALAPLVPELIRRGSVAPPRA